MTLTQLAESYLNSSNTSEEEYQCLIDKCNYAIEDCESERGLYPSVKDEIRDFVTGTEWENKSLPEENENEPFWKEFDKYYDNLVKGYYSSMDELEAKKRDAEEALKILANRGI